MFSSVEAGLLMSDGESSGILDSRGQQRNQSHPINKNRGKTSGARTEIEITQQRNEDIVINNVIKNARVVYRLFQQ